MPTPVLGSIVMASDVARGSPSNHEGLDPVGSLIQQCTAPTLSVGSMRRGVEGTQCRKGPFNLAIQVPQCPRLLLTQLIVEHVAISGSGND